jgi:uncharacterized coiled-coil DUF342 family protein
MKKTQHDPAQVAARRAHWQELVRAEIDKLLPQAATIHNQMTTAKTETKKAFYKKKFNSINAAIKKYTNTLQLLEPTQVNGITDEHINSTE